MQDFYVAIVAGIIFILSIAIGILAKKNSNA